MANVPYTELKKFIKSILKDADLNKLSSKMIRKQCEEKFNTELTSRKQEIDKLIMSCIDESADSKENEDADESESDKSSSESLASESEKESSEREDKPAPRKRKPSTEKKTQKIVVKKKTTTIKKTESDTAPGDDNDAEMARKLQEEEWNFRTRNPRRMVNKRVKAKTKTSRATSDKPKVQKEGGKYTRKCHLSAELAAVMDADEMARHDVVKKMWSIVRERNLFDPSNKQFAICDDQLRKLFGTKRIRMFGMMKRLQKHVKDLSDV